MTTEKKQSSRFPRSLVWAPLGLLAGAALAVIAPRLARSEPQSAAHAAPAEPPSSAVACAASGAEGSGRSDADAQRAIHRRLAALEEKVAQSSANEGSSPAPAAAGGPAAAPTREEAQKMLEGIVAKRREDHERQSVDAAWAGKVRTSLTEDLDGMGEPGKFHVVDVDCRTTSCAAVLEWTSYQAARESFIPVVQGHYRTNCARSFATPEPDDLEAPYRATLFLHCEDLRASGD